MLLKSTTRHIRIFAAEVVEADDELIPSSDTLTLDVDPDNELLWNDEALQQVYRKFDQLVAEYDGADLTDYNLRRIGSDLEHIVRSLLQAGHVSYNLNSRVRNYSLGLPRLDDEEASNHLSLK
jgi:NAD(P)H-quinone oxidoreductase subunit M